MRSTSITCTCLVLLAFVGAVDCGLISQERKVKLDESFRLETDEAVRTEDGKLTVRLEGVGRTISEGGETEYVELLVRSGNTEGRLTIRERKPRSAEFQGFVIHLVNAESFGKTHCELRILKRG